MRRLSCPAYVDRLAQRPSDLWRGNTLWDGHQPVAILDWDFAGVRPVSMSAPFGATWR